MAVKGLKPVTIAGIELDALISDDKSYQQDIPDYPTEEGYSVSDTIILKPITVSIVAYVANTPVTWSSRHGISSGRVNSVCKQLEQLYFSRKLVKVVTTDAIYTNMGITSMQITKSKELGNSRQISLSLKKVYVTKRKTVTIPSYILKSGETVANAGKATTSTSSNSAGNSSGSGSVGSGGSSSSSGKSNSSKAHSILYGAASSLGFI
ncbi:MAG: hypothetical protein RR275_05265 [Lachnospiraceae bacterium]